jgi:hypothetical protein
MLATGLHQNPHTTVTFYWRLKDHAGFLRGLGVEFDSVTPLMSRDFLVVCGTRERAAAAARVLEQTVADDGSPLFEVDNRGTELFVMLVYPKDITAATGYRTGSRTLLNLREHVAFVALKNGEHDGVGYLVDTGKKLDPAAEPIALTSLPSLVTHYLLGESFPPAAMPQAEA